MAFASLDDNDDGAGGVGAFTPYNGRIHGNERFTLLAAVAAKGIDVMNDNELESLDGFADGASLADTHAAEDCNEDVDEIAQAMMADASNEHLINVVLGADGTSDHQFFTNGLGLNTVSEGRFAESTFGIHLGSGSVRRQALRWNL